MAGLDSLNKYPNSVMARAVRLGQSRFRTIDEGLESAVVAINGAATTTTANLLTDFGLATQIDSLSILIVTSTSGVSIAQGGNTIILKAGISLRLPGPISPSVNPVTITTVSGDLVNLQAQGI